MIRRMLTAPHTRLGRWLAGADQPVAPKRTSFFDCESDTLQAALPRDPDEEEMAEWERRHFKINGQPLP